MALGIGIISKRNYSGYPEKLRAFWQRVRDEGGTMDSLNDVVSVYRHLITEGLIDNTELLYLANGGMVQREDGGLKFVRTAFDATDNDLDGSATASAQPRLVGGIAPNSKVVASNQSGEGRKFTHPTITVSGTYTTVKMMDTGGKHEFTYVEVTTGTLTEVTWTGNLRAYIVYAGTLSAGDRTALEAKLYTIYPEIESVDIGTETVATRNFEAVATPEGNVIANVTVNADWANATVLYDAAYAAHVGTTAEKEYAGLKAAAMWCYYNNDPDNGAIYGKILNKVAEKLLTLDFLSSGFGWHIPTALERETLETNSAESLKMNGDDYWIIDNGTNTTGFTLLPSGYRDVDGTFKGINDIGGFHDQGDDFLELGLPVRLIKD